MAGWKHGASGPASAERLCGVPVRCAGGLRGARNLRCPQRHAGLERVYLISSLTRTEAGPAQLLELNRGHWGIENRLHHVRDKAYDEDRCRARTGNTPRTLACLRNFAISLLRLLQVSNIKAALRDLAAKAHKVLKMFHM